MFLKSRKAASLAFNMLAAGTMIFILLEAIALTSFYAISTELKRAAQNTAWSVLRMSENVKRYQDTGGAFLIDEDGAANDFQWLIQRNVNAICLPNPSLPPRCQMISANLYILPGFGANQTVEINLPEMANAPFSGGQYRFSAGVPAAGVLLRARVFLPGLITRERDITLWGEAIYYRIEDRFFWLPWEN